MKFNEAEVKGYLMKRIENRKLFHTSNFHRRHYQIDFKEAAILVRKVHPDDW